MNNSIRFNPYVTKTNHLQESKQNEAQDNTTEYNQQVSLSQFPSFASRKPITSWRTACERMLKHAKSDNEYKSMRFATNEELDAIMSALENFETEFPKNKVLDKLLYCQAMKNSKAKEATRLKAEHIITYLDTMSGQPKEIQKRVLEFFSCTYEGWADKICSLLKDGKLSSHNLMYLNKKLIGTPIEKTNEFDGFMIAYAVNPKLIKHTDFILRQLVRNPELREYYIELGELAEKTDTSQFLKLISESTPKNTHDLFF